MVKRGKAKVQRTPAKVKRSPAKIAIAKKEANANRKKERCHLCGGMRFDIKRHLTKCKGTITETRASQSQGLRQGRKQGSKATKGRSTRAAVQQAIRSVPLRRLVRCNDEAGPFLPEEALALTPVEIRVQLQKGQALGVAGQDLVRDWGFDDEPHKTLFVTQDLCNAIHKIAGAGDAGDAGAAGDAGDAGDAGGCRACGQWHLERQATRQQDGCRGG